MTTEQSPKMYYRILGNTGLQVSVLSYGAVINSSFFSQIKFLGFWATFGAKEDLTAQQGIDLAKDCLRVARNGGINLFDNAETYGNPVGEAERIMGIAIQQLREEDPVKWRRSDIIITTKVPSPPLVSDYDLSHSLDLLGWRWCQ